MTNTEEFKIVPKVLIIDDDLQEADDTRFFIAGASPIQIDFQIFTPTSFPNLESLLPALYEHGFSAILIDQRLGETGTANYTGLQLASFLRNSFPILPLFILTKWAKSDSLEELGFDVDDVMDKALLAKHAATYVGRLLRALHRFEEARTETSKRMHELVKSSLTRVLTLEELEELSIIRASLGLWTLGQEIEETGKIKQRLVEKEQIIEALENLIKKES